MNKHVFWEMHQIGLVSLVKFAKKIVALFFNDESICAASTNTVFVEF